MPLIRVVDGDNSRPSRFHVAHAELIGEDANWCDQTLDNAQAEENPLWTYPHFVWGFDMTGDGVDHVLWGRELRARFAENNDAVQDMQDLSRTYVGHTITVLQDRAQILHTGSHVFLDTGAYQRVPNAHGVCDFNMGLTLWCHHENHGWRYNGDHVEELWLSV